MAGAPPNRGRACGNLRGYPVLPSIDMRTFLEKFQKKALDLMAAGEPVEPFLLAFCRSLEARLPGTRIGVVVLDRTSNIFSHAVFPGLPESFTDPIVGVSLASEKGPCAKAVLEGVTVDVTDIRTDTRFVAEWREHYTLHGFTAYLSVPAISTQGVPQGSLGVAYDAGSPLTLEQRGDISLAAELCAVICVYSQRREAQQILVGELEHRIRNLFSQVGAAANLTLRNHPEPRQFRRMLNDRLVAMARAHSLALDAVEIDLGDLLRDALAPYAGDFAIRIQGPGITLAREAALAFALAIHELATNATKYGCLSAASGVLSVQWSLLRAGDNVEDVRFSLSWVEAGGPRVAEPERSGYGTTTVKGSVRAAFDGVAELRYLAEGLRCEISAPFTPRLGREAVVTLVA